MVRAAESDADAAAGPQSPLELGGIVTTGAKFNGARVRKVLLILDDGGRVAVDLPTTARSKDWTKTKTGRAILGAMASDQRPMKAATIAKLAGSEYSGSFRQTLKGLVDQGEVVNGGDGYELSG